MSLKARGPWILALAFLVVLLPSLNATHLQEVDELIYARVARAAATQGHWMPFYWGAQPWSEKPPLLLWLTAGLLRFSGAVMASWPYRLGTCLGAAASAAALWRLAELEAGPWAGLLAGLTFAALGDVVFHARFFSMDTCLLACALWGFVSLAKGHYCRAGLWLALGVWIKTWFILGFFPALIYALWRSELGPDLKKALAWTLGLPLLSLAVVSGFYVAAYGRGFISHELWWNLIDRARGLSNEHHGSNLNFYGTWIAQTAPLVLPLGLAAPCLLLGSRRGVVTDLAVGLSVSWLLAICLIRAQVINYMLPWEAGLALCWGLLLAGPREGRRPWLLSALTILQVLAVLQWLDAENALLLSGLCALASLSSREFSGPAWLGQATSILAGLALLGMLRMDWLYLRAPFDATAKILEVVQAHPARYPGESLLYVGGQGQALDFYTDYKVEKTGQIPLRHPQEAMLVEEGGAAHFYPSKK